MKKFINNFWWQIYISNIYTKIFRSEIIIRSGCLVYHKDCKPIIIDDEIWTVLIFNFRDKKYSYTCEHLFWRFYKVVCKEIK